MYENSAKLCQLIKPERITEIDTWIAKYPACQKQSAVMSALRIVQEEQGYLTDELIHAIVALIPADWLDTLQQEASAEEHRRVYADFLKLRVSVSGTFVNEAINARRSLI